MTEVVFEVTRPQLIRVALVFSKMDICCPITVVEDAVRGVAVTVPVVAAPAVNGDPVASVKLVTAGRVELYEKKPHSVTASEPV